MNRVGIDQLSVDIKKNLLLIKDQETIDNNITKNYLNELILYSSRAEVCSKDLQIYYRNKYPLINYKLLNKYTKEKFYDVNIMKIASCIVSLLTSEKYTLSKIINPVMINDSDIEKKYIAFSSLIDTDDSQIVFKYDRKEFVLHEGIVGLYVGNEMRKILPTFVWTYGFTSCNLPIYTGKSYGGKTKVVTACNRKTEFTKIQNKKEYIGLISENINGIDLGEYLKNEGDNQKNLYSIILIILYSLNEAYNRFKFVHWDLHINNIMMRKYYKSTGYIEFGDKYIKIPGNYIPTIFDFGISSFEREDKVYGNYEFTIHGVHPEKGTPFIDAIKFLVSLFDVYVVRTDTESKKIHYILNKILSLIFVDDMSKTVDLLPYGYLPNSDYVKNYRFIDFIKDVNTIIKENGFDLILNNVNKRDIISCKNGECNLFEKELEKELFNREKILSLYDLKKLTVENINKNNINEYIENYIKTIPIPDIEEEIEDINYMSIEDNIIRGIEIKNLLEEIIQTVNELKRIGISEQYSDILLKIYERINTIYIKIRKFIAKKLMKKEKNNRMKYYFGIIQPDPDNMKNELQNIILTEYIDESDKDIFKLDNMKDELEDESENIYSDEESVYTESEVYTDSDEDKIFKLDNMKDELENIEEENKSAYSEEEENKSVYTDSEDENKSVYTDSEEENI
jgi:hypothetical protein